MALDVPARFVMGNADQEVLNAFDHKPSGEVLGDRAQAVLSWVVARISTEMRDFMSRFEPTVNIQLGAPVREALFCHASPRNNTEIFTALSPDGHLSPMLENVSAELVVCGHTHQQFDRVVGRNEL